MVLPLQLTLKPSRISLAIILLGATLALCGVWLASLAVWFKLLATLGVMMNLLRNPALVVSALRVSQSGELSVEIHNEWRTAELISRTIALPWIIQMRIKPEGMPAHTLRLWSDTADLDALRRLRVCLRCGLLATA